MMTGDAQYKFDSNAEMLHYTTKQLGNKDVVIVLMHDSATTRTTAEALPDIIQWYEDNGFAFLTVEQAVPLPTT